MLSTMLKLVATSFSLLVAYTSAAPINTTCTTTTSTDLYAYCSETTRTSDVDMHKLYEESDDIFGEIEKLCKITNCGNECGETATLHLTEDRDEQNNAINGLLLKIKSQLLLFEAPCKAYTDITFDENPLMIGLCKTLHSKLQQFTENIAQYLEDEKCGCNSKCFYYPGQRDLINYDDVPSQQLPCTIFKTIVLTQEVIRDVQELRSKARKVI